MILPCLTVPVKIEPQTPVKIPLKIPVKIPVNIRSNGLKMPVEIPVKIPLRIPLKISSCYLSGEWFHPAPSLAPSWGFYSGNSGLF